MANMILNELKSRHKALLAARYAGLRSLSYDGKQVSYGSDAELASAISDLERRIAGMERKNGTGRSSGRVLRPYAIKDL